MNNSKLILISGGKGSGKSNLVNHLEKVVNFEKAECKEKLHELTMQLFDVDRETYFEIYNNRLLKELPNENFKLNIFEAEKVAGAFTGWDSIQVLDQHWAAAYNEQHNTIVSPTPQFAFLSIRAAMIYVSEFVVKPLFGQEYFGIDRAKKVSMGTGVYVDDSVFGTMDEINPALDIVGDDNILLIKITGRGTFEGDSRRLLETERLTNQVWLHNPYDDENHEYVAEGIKIIIDFLNGGSQS